MHPLQRVAETDGRAAPPADGRIDRLQPDKLNQRVGGGVVTRARDCRHRDIAFAILVQDSGELDGGPRDGPLIARFLNAVDAAGLSGTTSL